MFKNQPKGLFALALANTGERFGYYTMLAIFLLFIQAKFGFSTAAASQIYSIFLAAVYFMPFFGGILADKIGYGKCVTIGVAVMFIGYICLSIPTAPNAAGMVLMLGALLLIAVGTGLFKGNLQVLVGNLYDDPKYSAKRDSAFSLFYMAINIGAMFAPSAATAITNWHLGKTGLVYNGEIPALAHKVIDGADAAAADAVSEIAAKSGMTITGSVTDFCTNYLDTLSSAYNLGFAVACVSLIVSMLIYFCFRPWFKHADVNSKQAAKTPNAVPVQELTKEQTKKRIVALVLVFAVVIFFWMAFHQNGSTLTVFARDYTADTVSGWQRIGFNIWALALIAVSVYTLFSIFQSESKKGKAISAVVTAGLWAGAYFIYRSMSPEISIMPQQFQQFNPFFVVALTPFSMAIFSWLANKGKEPSAPRKIGLGMFVAACGFLIMTLASLGLVMPQIIGGPRVGATTLMSTYLVLTFAELLLSPMGISFVSKVAPPKYKGMMMGGWFAATAIGNYLSSIPGLLWDKMPLWAIWAVLMGLCIIAGLVMFALMKRLEDATK
ncbi:MAG: peptide MFS transporter [Candidatus Cryptobacteroides sp.]